MYYFIGNTLIAGNHFNKPNHLYSALISGGAGSGKTQFIQKFIQDTIRLNSGTNLKFLIVDPKGDPSWENIIPQKYLYKDIVRFKNNDKVDKEIFNVFVKDEINELICQRQLLFQRFGVSNYYDYSYKERTINLPIIYLIIDELMDIYDLDYSIRQSLEKWLNQCRSAGIIPIYISHRFAGTIDLYIRESVALRVVLRSEKLLPELFNDNELKYIEKNFNLKSDDNFNNAGNFIAKLGETDSGWIKYKYEYLI